jgi:hypothetical protein
MNIANTLAVLMGSTLVIVGITLAIYMKCDRYLTSVRGRFVK